MTVDIELEEREREEGDAAKDDQDDEGSDGRRAFFLPLDPDAIEVGFVVVGPGTAKADSAGVGTGHLDPLLPLLVLVREILIDGADRDAGLGRNLSHADRIVAALPDQTPRGVQQSFDPFLASRLLRAPSGRLRHG